MNDFVPEKIEIPEGYRVDDVTNAYADAAELGLWIKEWAPQDGRFLTAIGSYYTLQRLEYDNPDELELDPQSFGLGDCMTLSLPGSGASRAEAIYDGIAKFKDSSLWEQHLTYHESLTLKRD
jgi:hypothetical protein